MSKKQPVLLIAHESYAGMGPYVASIINSFEPSDNIRFLVVEGSNRYYSKNIKSNLKPLTTFIYQKKQNVFNKITQILFDGNAPYENKVLQFIENGNFRVIHSLTSLTDASLTKKLSSEVPLLYTIHDFYHHEIKKVWYKMWRQKLLNYKVCNARRFAPNWITNSLRQLDDQKLLFPQIKHFFFPFPTLITETISNGTTSVPELKDVEKYILFFGRIEAYKGVEILISAFEKARFNENIKLVIAGKGELNYAPSRSDIIYINRYIGDEEIADLYKKASLVVYPYISATQSGVLSVATFFNTPIIASDLPFFKEVLGENYNGFFQQSNVDDLSQKLEQFFDENTHADTINFSKKIYEKFYSTKTIRSQLLKIYDNF